MIDPQEPQRLFESPEAPAALRSLLVRAHEDGPTAIEKAQLVRATLGRGGVERPPMHGRGSAMRWAAKAARRSTRFWSVAAIVGVGVGAGALYVAGVGPHAPQRAAEIPTVQWAEQPPPQDQSREDEPGRPTEEQRPPSVVAPRGASDASPLPAAEPAPAPAVRRDPFPVRGGQRRRARRAFAMAAETNGAPRDTAAAPLARDATPAPQASAPEQPRPDAVPVALAAAPPPPAVPAGRGVETAGSDEATLLRSARQALATSPRRTLSLTNEHRLRYPHGILDQEREALAIEALIKLGRLDEARPRARAFALAYPGSPHQARLDRALTAPALDAAP
jgi:hypothetical protein